MIFCKEICLAVPDHKCCPTSSWQQNMLKTCSVSQVSVIKGELFPWMYSEELDHISPYKGIFASFKNFILSQLLMCFLSSNYYCQQDLGEAAGEKRFSPLNVSCLKIPSIYYWCHISENTLKNITVLFYPGTYSVSTSLLPAVLLGVAIDFALITHFRGQSILCISISILWQVKSHPWDTVSVEWKHAF